MKNKGVKAFLKNHLVPHHGNKHTPHAVNHGALFSYSVGMVLLKFFALALAISFPAASVFSSAITRANIISLTNASRSTENLVPLKENDLLDASAQEKADDMLKNQYFAHTSPAGVTPWSWIKGTGYTYRYAGENLAVYFTSAEDVEAGWMASPTHRANIVDTRYTEIGVGVAQGEYNGYPAVFVVQHFGKPSVVTVAPEPVAQKEPAVTVTPQKDAYAIAVSDASAKTVSAHIGTENVTLEKTGSNTWQGSVPVNNKAIPATGEPLTVVLAGTDTGDVVTQAAIIAPNANTADVFAPSANTAAPRVFGFTLNAVNDGVTRIYLITVIFLAALLLITLISKMHWKRLPLAAHVIGVVGIAVLLMFI